MFDEFRSGRSSDARLFLGTGYVIRLTIDSDFAEKEVYVEHVSKVVII